MMPLKIKILQKIQTLNDYLFTITSKNSLGWHFLTSCCPCVAPCCCISITLKMKKRQLNSDYIAKRIMFAHDRKL